MADVEYKLLWSGTRAAFSQAQGLWARQAGAVRLTWLGGILLLGFWAGMSPHWEYPYPLHVDEWFAIGYAQSTLEAGGLVYPSPYAGPDVSFHPEMGFHLIWLFGQKAISRKCMGDSL